MSRGQGASNGKCARGSAYRSEPLNYFLHAICSSLSALAASQCTMNNFTFGNVTHQNYPTIKSGSGAGPRFSGTSVAQTHMSNSC